MPSDAPAIGRFQTTVWREVYAGIVPAAYLHRIGIAERTARWAQRITDGERCVLLAEVAGQLVGVVSWGRGDGAAPVELKSLYVAASRRGSGLGAELLDAALGSTAATLWVFEANTAAQRFYRRHGFVADGARAIDVDTGVCELRMVRPG